MSAYDVVNARPWVTTIEDGPDDICAESCFPLATHLQAMMVEGEI